MFHRAILTAASLLFGRAALPPRITLNEAPFAPRSLGHGDNGGLRRRTGEQLGIRSKRRISVAQQKRLSRKRRNRLRHKAHVRGARR